ncbi:MAG: FG-GAP repeat protein [Actinomycetota bacterium]
MPAKPSRDHAPVTPSRRTEHRWRRGGFERRRWTRLVTVAGCAALVAAALQWGIRSEPAWALTDDNFAYHVAVEGDTLIAGAPLDDVDGKKDAGSASIFVRSGTDWIQKKLKAPDGGANDGFGRWVDISGDTVVIAAPSHATAAGPGAGAAYVFVRSNGDWQHQFTLTARDGKAGDLFSRSVAISGDTVVVGAPFHDHGTLLTDSGSAYVFVRNGTTWSQQQEIREPDAAANDRFAHAVDIDGETIIVGSPQDDGPNGGKDVGSASVFVRSGEQWSRQARFVHKDPRARDRLGRWVTIHGNTAVASVPSDDTTAGGTDAGSAFIFVRSGTTWTRQLILESPEPGASDHFGFRADLNGDTLAISSPYDDTPAGVNAGTAFVYLRSGTTWTLQQSFREPNPEPKNFFGRGIAVDLDTLVVGAPYDNNFTGTYAGTAYAYVRSGTTWTFQATINDAL